MEKVDFIEKDFGLKRIIASNVATHNLGNNLDGIWTNMKTSSCILHDGLLEITDHSLIEVNLLVDESVSRQLPQGTDEYITQADNAKPKQRSKI